MTLAARDPSFGTMLVQRRRAIALLCAICASSALALVAGRASLALLTLVLICWFAYVTVFCMRLKTELGAPPTAADLHERVGRAIDATVRSRSRRSWSGHRLVVRPADHYAIRFELRDSDGPAVLLIEADSPMRGLLSRSVLLDRSSVWERLLVALADEGFESQPGV